MQQRRDENRRCSGAVDVAGHVTDVLLTGREFGHIHPDGSLHLWLLVELASQVDAAKWGELHLWVVRDEFWDGVAMVFTPESPEEIDVVIRLMAESYNFVSGANVDPREI